MTIYFENNEINAINRLLVNAADITLEDLEKQYEGNPICKINLGKDDLDDQHLCIDLHDDLVAAVLNIVARHASTLVPLGKTMYTIFQTLFKEMEETVKKITKEEEAKEAPKREASKKMTDAYNEMLEAQKKLEETQKAFQAAQAHCAQAHNAIIQPMTNVIFQPLQQPQEEEQKNQ